MEGAALIMKDEFFRSGGYGPILKKFVFQWDLLPLTIRNHLASRLACNKKKRPGRIAGESSSP